MSTDISSSRTEQSTDVQIFPRRVRTLDVSMPELADLLRKDFPSALIVVNEKGELRLPDIVDGCTFVTKPDGSLLLSFPNPLTSPELSLESRPDAFFQMVNNAKAIGFNRYTISREKLVFDKVFTPPTASGDSPVNLLSLETLRIVTALQELQDGTV